MINRKRIHYFDKKIAIKFPYDLFLLSKVRELEERAWNNIRKTWYAKPTIYNMTLLMEDTFEDFLWSPEAKTLRKKYKKKIAKKEAKDNKRQKMSSAETSKIKIRGLGGKLRPYQKAGIAYIESTKGRTLIGDAPGLGKTIQALGWLQYRKGHLTKEDALPALVVCPSSVKLNWRRESRKWLPKSKALTVFTDTKYKTIRKRDIVVINYELFKRFAIREKKVEDPKTGEMVTIYKVKKTFKRFKTLILDECTHCKNEKAQRTQTMRSVEEYVDYFLALSGTPFLNRPVELYPTLSLLNPKEFGNFWNFVNTYCDAKKGHWGWDFKGASNLDQLAEHLRSTVMVRRLKEDVLDELPPKQRTPLLQQVDLTAYNKVEENLAKWLIDNKDFDALEAVKKVGKCGQLMKIEYCKQEAVKAKYPVFLEWVNDFMEDTDEKLVIFAHHKDVIQKLKEDLKEFKPLTITGNENAKEKDEAQQRFQRKKKHRIVICSLKAASMAITLTKASKVAILELGWTPGEHVQAEDRLHRFGQLDYVMAYYFIAAGTIDEIIYKLLQKKQIIFDRAMGDKKGGEELTQEQLAGMHIGGDLIKGIIKKVRKKKKKKKGR